MQKFGVYVTLSKMMFSKKNLSRSVWYYPLRLDAALYIEVVFNQIAPDYLEGLLLVLPGEHLPQEIVVSTSVYLSELEHDRIK